MRGFLLDNILFSRTLPVILLALLSVVGFSQDTADIYLFGGLGSDHCRDIQATADGGFVTVGATGSFGTSNNGVADLYLVKYDSTIGQEWSAVIGQAGVDWGNRVALTADGGYIVAGFTNSSGMGGYDCYLAKTDAQGNLEWDRTYGGTDWDFAESVVQTPDGGYLMIGHTQSFGSGQSDIWIVKTDDQGMQEWEKIIGGAKNDIGRDVIVTSHNKFLVVGEITADTSDSSDIYYALLDSSGTEIWSATHGYNLADGGYRAVEHTDSNFAIIGYISQDGPLNKETILFKVDTLGNTMWEQLYLNGGTVKYDEIGKDLEVLPGGWFLLGGYTETASAGKKDYFSFIATPGGWWTPNSSSYGDTEEDDLFGVEVLNDGRMVLAGTTFSFGNGLEDMMFVVVDSIKPGLTLDYQTVTDNGPKQVTAIPNSLTTADWDLLIYPNPAQDYVNVSLEGLPSGELVDFSLTDPSGRLIHRQSTGQSQFMIDCQALPRGIYFYRVQAPDRTVQTGKLIVH